MQFNYFIYKAISISCVLEEVKHDYVHQVVKTTPLIPFMLLFDENLNPLILGSNSVAAYILS